MKLTVFPEYRIMCRTIAYEITALLTSRPESLICLAAGHTSLGVFESLIEDFKSGKADFSKASFIAMDEWINMNENTDGSCGYFLRYNFLSYVNFDENNVFLPNGMNDLEKECRDMEQFIEKHSLSGVIDFTLLGTGMNGHLALNEPGTSIASAAHVTELDSVTKQVGQKYFSSAVPLQGGITLGIGDFMKCKRVILSVSSEHKREILDKIMQNSVFNPSVPATAVFEMSNASIYCDQAAVSFALL